MFPIKSGLGTINTPETETVFVQSLVCSALNEIAKQAIIDTSILFFHQMEVEVYHSREKGEDMPEDSEGVYVVYTPEEEKELRSNLREIVWKYHILSPHGLVSRLNPLVTFLQNGESIPPDAVKYDPFLLKILANNVNYTDAVYNGNTSAIIEKIINFNEVENMSNEEYEELIRASRDDGNEYVSVAIYEDDSIQCECDYCTTFFEANLLTVNNEEEYNFLQRIMIQNFNL